MPVLRDIGFLAPCAPPTGDPGGEAPPTGPADAKRRLGGLRDAALAWRDGGVVWLGPDAELPAGLAGEPAVDAGGRLVTPGLVDCHTHLAFGGWRADEFERRLAGESYAEIARSGGGILSTVRATRAASEDRLVRRARGFLREMARLGVTTVEAKSGYGLALEEELKLLRVYRRLGAEGSVPRLVPTFLGAHAVPPEYGDDRAGYVERLVEEWIPAVAADGLARFCDVFVEDGAFTPTEARRILEAGSRHGLAAKLHADQLSDSGGAALAAELGAASADHLEHVSAEGVSALADAGVVGVVLPLAGLYLGQAPAPARDLADAGVPVGVATDFNPGTAPSWHLPLALTLSCLRGGLTPAEALLGATVHAARAVGLDGRAGTLEPGASADFALFDAADPTGWLYHFRPNACVATVARGEVVWNDPEEGPLGSLPGPGPAADDAGSGPPRGDAGSAAPPDDARSGTVPGS